MRRPRRQTEAIEVFGVKPKSKEMTNKEKLAAFLAASMKVEKNWDKEKDQPKEPEQEKSESAEQVQSSEQEH